jgi:2-methylcitrate dehydratase PrpD
MNAAARFATHALATSFEDLPADAVLKAKTFVLDSLGVGIAGTSLGGGAGLLAVASSWGAVEEAQVWGRTARLPAPAAAFLNAWHMHNQEFDCLHDRAFVHAMASVLPAAMAAADRRGGVPGKELIVAIAVGVDVAASLGMASRAGFRFFRPATAGGFGAVAAAGRVLGLDEGTLAGAFAWQLAQASGTMQAHQEGSPIIPAQVGFNARSALHACELAPLGFSPTRNVFEGEFGYLPLFEADWDLAPALDALGQTFLISGVSHKPYPAGRAAHAGIEGAATLQRTHGFAAEDVDQVLVIAPRQVQRMVGRPVRPDAGPAYARLCIGYAIAKVLQHGALDLAHFRGKALADTSTHALAERVRVEADGTTGSIALAPQRVVVRLRSGVEHEWGCETLPGCPMRPLDRERHLAKFRRCLDFAAEPLAPDAAERLIAMVDRLDELPDTRELSALVAAW